MWVRIAADFPVWYEPEILAMYRIRSLSLSDGTSRSGENLLDLRRAIEINTSVLPPEHRHRWTVRAKELNALGALRRASRALDNGDAVTAAAQIRGAMNLSRSPRVLRHVARLSLRQWRLERRRMRSGTESR
jgi:hypothetical protein